MKNYLKSLMRKHRHLDNKIKKMGYDSEKVRELKKLRLSLKDRIQAIHRGPMRQSA